MPRRSPLSSRTKATELATAMRVAATFVGSAASCRHPTGTPWPMPRPTGEPPRVHRSRGPPSRLMPVWVGRAGTGCSSGVAVGELSPRIAGPMMSVDNVNMAAKTTRASAGARQFPDRRLRRSRNGMETAKPTTPNRIDPPVPVSSAAPAIGPTWCRTCGAIPDTTPTAPVTAVQTRRRAAMSHPPRPAGARDPTREGSGLL